MEWGRGIVVGSLILLPAFVESHRSYPTDGEAFPVVPGDWDEVPYSLFMRVVLGGQEFRSLHYETQLQVQECMGARGWEYIPVPYEAQYESVDLSTSWAKVREYRTEFGYGLAMDSTMTMVNPNFSIIDRLDQERRYEYFADLAGSDTTEEANVAGCVGAADDVFRNAGYLITSEEYGELVNEFISRVSQHPAALEAFANWSGCMALSGHPSLADWDDAVIYAQTILTTEGEGRSFEELAPIELAIASADISCVGAAEIELWTDAQLQVLRSLVRDGYLPPTSLEATLVLLPPIVNDA